MLQAIWVLIVFLAGVLAYLLERAEHCRCCGAWFRFHQHQFGSSHGFMCRSCGQIKEMK